MDLSDVVVSRPVVLRDCTTDEPVLLDRARLTSLDLSGLVAPAGVRRPAVRAARGGAPGGGQRAGRAADQGPRQRDLVGRGRLTRWGGLWHRITGATVGYGYRPAVAPVWLLGTLAAAATPGRRTGRAGAVLWRGRAGRARAERRVPPAKPDGVRCQLVTTSGLGQVVMVSTWVLQVLAWAFATLFVAGFTGLVRKTS